MTAISGALTLLTNIVIAWNAAQFQSALKTHCSDRPKDHFRHIAPIAHAHINMRGMFVFATSRKLETYPIRPENSQKTVSDTA